MYKSAARTLVSILMFSSLLAACGSGEPSAQDMQQALEQDLQELNNITTGLLGAQAKVSIVKIEKIGCKSAGQQPGFICDLAITSSKPILGESTEKTQARFVKGENSWHLFK